MVEVTNNAMEQDMAGAQDTIYLCNFRVSVDGEWLCLKELQDVEFNMQNYSPPSPEIPIHSFGRDPVAIERSNLLNISKLVVKELIEQSLRYGRMLDSDYMPLQHFFIVLEHVLRHGLKLKKGLLGPKKELWDILQLVEKYAPEAQDITSSVRDLPTVRTHMGRARAWLRLALMQKKLADYLKVLIDHKDETLVEYYEPDALMLSDEVVIIIGLLVGLNVIDCNLCVKEEDLDCPQGVIDFSLYLRSSSQVTEEDHNEEQGEDNMITVLDQKSYMEELNRHLNATVTNLQSKVESLTTENALMKEDLSIAKNSLYNLFEENRQLKKELEEENSRKKSMRPKRDSSTSSGEQQNDSKNKTDTVEIEKLRKQLDEEQNARQEAEKELELQMCLKAEMEVAMKLLEKDIHEKQDTIISLRRQLEEIKLINLEMYKKLQECEVELTQKGEMVSRLQAKAGQIGKILNNLEKYNHLIKEAEHDKKHCDRKTLDRKRMSLPKSLSKDSCLKVAQAQPQKNNSLSTEENQQQSGSSKNSNNFNELDETLNCNDKNESESNVLNKNDSKDDVNDFEIVNVGKNGCLTPEVEDECEGSLKHKTEFSSKLEAKIQSMTESMQILETKFKESELARQTVEQKRKELDVHAAQQEELTNTYEGDLKNERDWRISLQDTLQQERERTSKLQQELAHLRSIAQKYATVQEEYYNLKEHCLEQEQTLEELGIQLSTSKLQISDLKEEVCKSKTEGTWVSDKESSNCKMCNKEFNVTRRKHHCRNCGEIFCKSCSDNSMSLPSSAKPVRVCDNCFILLVGRNSVM